MGSVRTNRRPVIPVPRGTFPQDSVLVIVPVPARVSLPVYRRSASRSRAVVSEVRAGGGRAGSRVTTTAQQNIARRPTRPTASSARPHGPSSITAQVPRSRPRVHRPQHANATRARRPHNTAPPRTRQPVAPSTAVTDSAQSRRTARPGRHVRPPRRLLTFSRPVRAAR
jgi:hypothetical protein